MSQIKCISHLLRQMSNLEIQKSSKARVITQRILNHSKFCLGESSKLNIHPIIQFLVGSSRAFHQKMSTILRAELPSELYSKKDKIRLCGG